MNLNLKIKLRRFLLENIFTKKQYLGQCDLLRHKCEENEEYWHDMMKNRKKIPLKTFIKSVDIEAILDSDVNPNEFIKELLMEDSETASYVSNWGDRECMFLQTSGFEFIFV